MKCCHFILQRTQNQGGYNGMGRYGTSPYQSRSYDRGGQSYHGHYHEPYDNTNYQSPPYRQGHRHRNTPGSRDYYHSDRRSSHHHSRNRSRSRSRSPYYPRQHRDDRRRSSRSAGQSPCDNRSPLRTNTTHNSVGSEATKVAAAVGGESQAAVYAHEN